MTVRRTPIDFEALEKGRVFTVEEIEEIVGLDAEHEHFPLRRLALMSRIEREMAERGRPVCLRQEQGSIKVMTDPEAAEYQPKEFDRHRRGMARSLRRLGHIDGALLDEAQRQELEANSIRMGRIYAAIQKERKQISDQVRRKRELGAGQ